jgi:RNA polymerase sigma factor (sigma-70 family)
MSTPADTFPSSLSSTASADRSDEALMLAYASESDIGAFDALYARHEMPLYRFVRRLLGAQAAEGDEVFQEAWVRIVAARAGFTQQSLAWRTWAFAFVCGLALDRLGASGRQVRFFPPRDDTDFDGDDEDERPDDLDGVPPDAAGGTTTRYPALDDAALWRAAGRRLLDGLNGLPAEQRAMLLLRHDHGFTTPMLVDTLGLPVDTVRSGLRHGAGVLHACMADPDGSGGDRTEKHA